ncbi:plastocyanin/azurin family copper-binding protein [Algoriphagus sp. AGSA1]|uniref:plastocyanin/azurin family copper-binding protein n=1 Tax=Algoriphagus sp. AGSA1 TaxID=2907213 RepID=UPI001F2EA24E|nr:plastocyanin/azurin family copper-binding protein [Algoriphagus sp. AGSA1]MCE7053429.1 plastocyanin/azurin family copper-binding protein [Algoriphagus sp. AGSA1]
MIKATLFPIATLLLASNWFYFSTEIKPSVAIALCETNPIETTGKRESSSLTTRNAERRETTILLEIVPEMMKFDQDTFTVKASDKIILEIDNLDGMEHNLLITKPGTLDKVGAAADAMLRDPKASEKFYVPEIPEVLFSTKMIGPQELYTLTFTAPTQPGHYPFVCTFPGHWRMMNGIMKVES